MKFVLFLTVTLLTFWKHNEVGRRVLLYCYPLVVPQLELVHLFLTLRNPHIGYIFMH